jgi:hypothetical protein
MHNCHFFTLLLEKNSILIWIEYVECLYALDICLVDTMIVVFAFVDVCFKARSIPSKIGRAKIILESHSNFSNLSWPKFHSYISRSQTLKNSTDVPRFLRFRFPRFLIYHGL